MMVVAVHFSTSGFTFLQGVTFILIPVCAARPYFRCQVAPHTKIGVCQRQ